MNVQQQEKWKFTYSKVASTKKDLTVSGSPKSKLTGTVITEGKNYSDCLAKAMKEAQFTEKHLIGSFPIQAAFLPRDIKKICNSLVSMVEQGKLIWQDPDPIPGNDYTVKSLQIQPNGETAIITYGRGSEARVYLSELV